MALDLLDRWTFNDIVCYFARIEGGIDSIHGRRTPTFYAGHYKSTRVFGIDRPAAVINAGDELSALREGEWPFTELEVM